MSKFKRFSEKISVFHGRQAPEEGWVVGYAAIINSLALSVPMPPKIVLISEKHRQYEQENWVVLTPRYKPEESLLGHLVLAIKYQGIDLLFFKKLFETLDVKEIEGWIKTEPQGKYIRKIWFLFEWLMQKPLNVPDLREGNYDMLIDIDFQYGSNPHIRSSRHRIYNNLPGSNSFCPLIRRTEKIDDFIAQKLDEQTSKMMGDLHRDLVYRTSSFLLLKDSKASFTIEGENPPLNRATRWGRVIGEAGRKPITKEELLRLQQIVIDQSRFVTMGFRTEGGFVGEQDRETGQPIPDHISAKWEDIPSLLDGLLATSLLFEKNNFHPVLATTIIAFGFVFIHPFSDGNGRIHRYLIHHQLARMKFTPEGFVFPVSAAILEKINEYRRLLESYSHPILDFIKWQATSDNNVEVLNQTIDYYRYFDATSFVEFLFDCISHTIHHLIPQEIQYLKDYDEMKNWLDDQFQMPDKTIAILTRFLEQNEGKLSKRAREKEFSALKDEEITAIEKMYKEIFIG
jgi:Fic family protein